MSVTAAGKPFARGLSTAAVGALVVAVAAMMIVPLPTWLVDLLIVANLGASVVLLLSCAYSGGALPLASFPTVLVLVTLFRLGLNVSTVRLILLQADAGQVVRSFGAFVVRGDYVVGLAVFLVLTIVQYVVIARGAERVAEVAARFALDAMPGRQLAIDADLRAGAIDAGEARRRRDALQREAQLFGSLDGAMRFVKGDAVAGLLILGVSLVGGLLIGVLRRNMALGDAASLYTLLTIGDGLASQIPALLLSTGAGLLVTRVATEEEGEAPGLDLLRQLSSKPGLLLAAAGLLGVLAAIPGLPVVPFGALGLALGATALVLLQRNKPATSDGKGALLPSVQPAIAVRVSPLIASRPELRAGLTASSRRIVEDLGVPLEPPAITVDSALPVGSFALVIRGVVVARGAASTDVAQLVAALDPSLRRHVSRLLGPDETQRLLDTLSLSAPALVRETVPRRIDLGTLTDALRRLLDEEIPLGDLREVLETLSMASREPERDPVLLAEKLRARLAPRISARLAPDGHLAALVLAPMAEEALRDSVRPAPHIPGGLELALEPDLAADLLASLESLREREASNVIVTSPDLRRHVRRLVEESHPEIAVISFGELLPSVVVEPVGQIGP